MRRCRSLPGSGPARDAAVPADRRCDAAGSAPRRLLLLAAVAILPLALMSGIALQALLEQQRQQTEQSSLDLARALATAVDTELRLTVSALQSLALTEPIDCAPTSIDLARAHRLARRVLARAPNGARCCSPHADGRRRCSAPRTPFGAPPPKVAEPDSLAEVVRIACAGRRPADARPARQLRHPGARSGRARRRAALRADGGRPAGGDPARRQRAARAGRLDRLGLRCRATSASRARASTSATSAARRRRRCTR